VIALSSLECIRNFVRLTDDFGTAGQPRREQFQFIADSGFTAVINLAMPQHADSIDDEGRLVTELGMNYFHLPVPFDKPEIDHLRQFFALLDAQAGRKLFIHCILNYRVSAFMYLYLRLRRNFTERQARSPILEKWEMEPQWRAIMQLQPHELEFNPDVIDGNP